MEDAPASAALIPIHLERREPARNIQRFYAITVSRIQQGVKDAEPIIKGSL